MKMSFSSAFYLCVAILSYGYSPAGSSNIDVSELLYATGQALDYSIKTSYGGSALSAKSGRRVSSKVFETKMDVEKAIFQAQSSPVNGMFTEKRLQDLVNSVALAVKKGKFRYARSAYGTGIYGQIELARRSRRKKRSTSNVAAEFIRKIRIKVGRDKFRKMMRIDEDATLMFAIDTTGSMMGEIAASKSIAQAIANWPREQNLKVNYRLSPFNDPVVGPVISRNHSQGRLFAWDIGNLTADGGGDCPEPSTEAMCNAMTEPSDAILGSPLFVFTDASPKDIREKEDLVKMLAADRRVTITFFLVKESCEKPEAYDPYVRIAESTNGHVFNLPSTEAIKNMRGLTAASLRDFVLLCSVKHNPKRKKRLATTSFSDVFIVDGPFDDLIVTVETSRAATVTLTDAQNHTLTADTVYDGVAVYIEPSPPPGVYALSVSSSQACDVRYTVKGASLTKIEFSVMFVLLPQHQITSKETQITHPLKGKEAFVRVMLEGASRVRHDSLTMKLVNKAGVPIASVNFTKQKNGSQLYTARFVPPASTFRLQLMGETNKGMPFQRVSKDGPITARKAVVYFVPGREDGRLKLGKKSFLMFKLFNAGRGERFVIKIKDTLGILGVKFYRFTVGLNMQRSLFVAINPTGVLGGAINKIVVKVEGRTSRESWTTFQDFQIVA